MALFKRALIVFLALGSFGVVALEFEFEGSKHYGQTASGAYYSIAIPDGWVAQDGLVIWNHGFEGYLEGWETIDLLEILDPNWPGYYTGEPQPQPGLGPWENIVLAQGYAMAASSYSQTGWAVFDSHVANQELYEAFIEEAGLGATEPEPFYIIGASLGGIVSMRDIETAEAQSGSGGLPEADAALLACGAVGGAENWRMAFDTRMIYEAICSVKDDAELPQPWYTRPNKFGFDEADLIGSLESCVALSSRLGAEKGVMDLQQQIDDETNPVTRIALIALRDALIPEWENDNEDEATRLYDILELTNTPSTEFLAIQLWYAVFELPRLIEESAKLNGLIPFHNVGIDYRDAELNQTIQRSIALPSSIVALNQNYTPTGLIGNTKLLSFHNNLDGLVRVENQNTLFANPNIPANQLLAAVVEESSPTHCGFRESEGIAAWNALQEWVATDVKPSPADLQNRCEAGSSAVDPDLGRELDFGFEPDQKCRFIEDYEYRETLATFPRAQQSPAIGNNTFDGSSGVVTLEAVLVPEEGNLYGAQLVPIGENTMGLPVFDVFSAWLSGAIGNWQHSAYYDEHQELLYVPGLNAINAPAYTDSYKLYMRRTGVSGNSLELLEYEVSN